MSALHKRSYDNSRLYQTCVELFLHIQSRYCTVKQFLLRVVRDVNKAENGYAVAFIVVQSYAEELETDILERGLLLYYEYCSIRKRV